MDTVPTLEDRLEFIRECSSVDLFTFICQLSLESDSRVPSDFLSCRQDILLASDSGLLRGLSETTNSTGNATACCAYWRATVASSKNLGKK
jgi:hypothetical protein